MNYPIWELLGFGGGSLIALISIPHVYISHLAVGGGAFLWLTDLWGQRQGNSAVIDYVRKHTWFFLLLTMVFGGITGVGIWFVIALVSPAATSTLIHNFVFGWAIEWVFFVGEIVALLLYHYRFDKMNPRARLNIAFLYFLFAWLSMVIINGILSFMLTPGRWLETQYFWHGFFNPTYFSSLVFRTAMAAMIAGLFGFVTTVFLKDSDFRSRMMRYCSLWLLIPLPVMILAAFWYYTSIPETIRFTAFTLNPQTGVMVWTFIVGTVILFVGGVLALLRSNRTVQGILTLLLVLIGLVWMGGFEYTREIARKPYVLNQYMYSTSIPKACSEKINEEGMLARAKWTEHHAVTPDNVMAAGRELFNLECLSCHTVNGVRNDVVPLMERYTYEGILALLQGQGKVQTYMPPFLGTRTEMEALAQYLTVELLGKKRDSDGVTATPAQIETELPPFDEAADEYVLLVWNDLGMHCISDSDPWFVILPPANTLEAQLFLRGEVPEQVMEGVKLEYAVEAGFEHPSKHVEFWEYAPQTFGVELEDDMGLFGKGLSGEMDFDADRFSWIAAGIPVAPYKDDGSYNPYPTFTVRAVDEFSGEVLVETKVVAPTSTEMGCRNCHEGSWRTGTSGIDDETAVNLLLVHDQLNGTDLYKEALAGEPKLCQSCHADPALGAPGDSTVLNFSAAMHGWHANYMPYEDARACVMCHPAAKGGNTQCSRGFHNTLGVTCTDCHGTMSEHGLALLKAEEQKEVAQRLMKNLVPSQVASAAEVNSRWPWLQEPDCLTCHVEFEAPIQPASAFNIWNTYPGDLYRMRHDWVDIRCEACHGATHALYPAHNPYDRHRDNMQPMQYGGLPLPLGSNGTCAVCHTQEMEDAVHHPNMEHPFRNAELLK